MENNNSIENLDLRIHHQLLSFEKDISKKADCQRKSIAHLLKASFRTLNNDGTIALLDNKLKTYSDMLSSNEENVYDNKLKACLTQWEKPVGNFKSNLNTIDPKQYIKPLSCTNIKSYCPESENFSKTEFEEFIEIFKNKKTDTPEVTTNCRQENTYTSSNISSDIKLKQGNERFTVGTSSNCFKTAREELEIQNLQRYGSGQESNRYGNGQESNAQTVQQKRKFGSRNKFIPPIKSNSGSNDDKLDERLKNIEPKMVELIKSEIMDCMTSLHWDDIAGLTFAKNAIQEAVVWPLLRPDIFTGLRKPPKGILLFGPPGTGKTLIGKCVASQSKSTFFSISASSLTSKWVGDGEKMVRALFAVARVHQPSVIFIDEVDSLLSQRTDSEHESSRRIKTEFLVQLDGATTDSDERLLVIGATNRPQELDEAARRRFVKRLYIPLPEYEARLQLIQRLISGENHQIQEEDFKRIASLSNGYSGADIKYLCSEASLGPIRSIDMNLIEHIQASDVRPLIMEDFEKALTRVKSSVAPSDLEQYISWDKIYGSGF